MTGVAVVGLVVLILLVALGVLGAVLVWTGWWPRRRGATPRCGTCDYNLTGLDWRNVGCRCPECGSFVDVHGIVLGERPRRPLRAVGGLLCLLLALVPLGALVSGYVAGVNWYAYKPTAWVIGDIRSSNATLATRALAEIQRRMTVGPLTAAQTMRLAEACLAEQARPTLRQFVCQAAVDSLYDLYAAQKLSDEQKERYFSNMASVWLEMRPQMVQGKEFLVAIGNSLRAPSRGLGINIGLERLYFGDVSMDTCWGVYYLKGVRVNSRCPYSVRPEILGSQAVAAHYKVQVVEPIAGAENAYCVRHTTTGCLRGNVEVQAIEPPDLVRLVHSPELDAAARQIEVAPLRFRPDASAGGKSVVPGQSCVVGGIWFHGVQPVNFAFGAYMKLGEREVRLGDLTQPKGGMPGGSSGSGIRMDELTDIPARVTIVLRSSKELAWRRTFFDEIWDGELWFEDVEVVADGYGGPAIMASYLPEIRRRGEAEERSGRAAATAATTAPAEKDAAP